MTSDYYWSSSQYDAFHARDQLVGLGGGSNWQYFDAGKSSADSVRAVRAF